MDVYQVLDAYYKRGKGDTGDFSLIEEYAEKVLATEDYSFETGLLGLGWLIAYLIRTEYLEGDGDEILYDIDDTLYKFCLKEVMREEINIDNLLSFIAYYQERLQYESSAGFYRRFTHFECMKLLVQRLNEHLDQALANNDRSIIIQSIPILLKYSYLLKGCVDKKLIEPHFHACIEQLIDMLKRNPALLSDNKAELGKLMVCFVQSENLYRIQELEHIYPHLHQDSSTENKDCLWYLLAQQWDKRNELDPFTTQSLDNEKLLFEVLTNITPIKDGHVKANRVIQ